MTDPSARPAQGNLVASLPAASDGERFETLFANAVCCVERIVSFGHASPPGFWYEQDEDEWVVLLQGQAVMDVDGRTVPLTSGDHLFLPTQTPHTVLQVSDGALWLAVHLHPIP